MAKLPQLAARRPAFSARSAAPALICASRSSDWRSSREICICETPISRGDLALRHVLDEAQPQDPLLALGQAPDAPSRAARAPRRGRSRRRRCRACRRSSCRCRRRRGRRSAPRATARCGSRARRAPRRPPRGSRRCARRAGAASAALPVSASIASAAERTLSASSCVPRATWTPQPVSRKWRSSSPTIVGWANVEKLWPRSGSKRSTALIRPSEATWTRSSSGSLPRR